MALDKNQGQGYQLTSSLITDFSLASYTSLSSLLVRG